MAERLIYFVENFDFDDDNKDKHIEFAQFLSNKLENENYDNDYSELYENCDPDFFCCLKKCNFENYHFENEWKSEFYYCFCIKTVNFYHDINIKIPERLENTWLMKLIDMLEYKQQIAFIDIGKRETDNMFLGIMEITKKYAKDEDYEIIFNNCVLKEYQGRNDEKNNWPWKNRFTIDLDLDACENYLKIYFPEGGFAIVLDFNEPDKEEWIDVGETTYFGFGTNDFEQIAKLLCENLNGETTIDIYD